MVHCGRVASAEVRGPRLGCKLTFLWFHAASCPRGKNEFFKATEGHFLDKMRRSAHRRKRLNKTDLTMTKRLN